MYRCKKTFSGFSCAFRNWRAESHCRFIHGYSPKIKMIFEAPELDARGWVVDFGGMKDLKGWLEDWFDHKTIIAEDDPFLNNFEELHEARVIDLRIMPTIGCEAFADAIFQYTSQWMIDAGFSPRCHLVSVEFIENENNSATFTRPQA